MTPCTWTHLRWWEQFLHPGQLRTCGGYWFWSGVGSDFGEITLFTAVAALAVGFYRHHNCHVDGCRRIGHMDPVVHHPACRTHHSHARKLGKA